MSVIKEGFPFIITPLAAGIFFLLLGRGAFFTVTGIVLMSAALFCTFFFRDPARTIPPAENLVLSPCDGRVLEVTEEDGMRVVRVFLSVFNVHLQRSPVKGVVKTVHYKPGKFVPAMVPKAHEVNEQNTITIESERGVFKVKQIAGMIARRIVAWVQPGQDIVKGGKIGLIKFGSQVDLYMPREVAVNVRAGDRVVGGETVVGELP